MHTATVFCVRLSELERRRIIGSATRRRATEETSLHPCGAGATQERPPHHQSKETLHWICSSSPHPSISDTSMWDKSIMCLWKLIWKLAACWGLENLAIAFLCCGIILNISMGPMDMRRFFS